MARIRTIKPEFFTSEQIVALSPLGRLLFIALWCEADREGRLVWKPLTFKLRYFPGDACDMSALCQELVEADLVRLYDHARLAYIPSFRRHQYVNPRETASQLPSPEDKNDASARVTDAPVTHRQEGKESRKGETRDSASPLALTHPIVQGQRRNVAIPWRVPLPGDLWAEWRRRLADEDHQGDEEAAGKALEGWAMALIRDWGDKPTGGDDPFGFWRARFAEWRGTTRKSLVALEAPAPRLPKASEVNAAQGIPARKAVAR